MWGWGPASRKRTRDHSALSSTISSDVEDSVDPSLSAEERRELLSDSESEESDDGDLGEPDPKKRLIPSDKTQSYLESTKLLKNERRKSVLGKHPIPASDQAHPPKLDKAVAALVC